MIQHISMFRLKPEFRTGQVLSLLTRQLEALPDQVPSIVDCEIGIKLPALPAESPDGQVQFYDLVQRITFSTAEDCAGYPMSQGHQAFLRLSGPYMEHVAVIEYPCPPGPQERV